MLVKVFSENDLNILLSLGCKVLSKKFTSNIDKVDVAFDLYVPVEKIEDVKKTEVNFIQSSRLTF